MTMLNPDQPYWQGKLVRLRALEPEDWEHFYLHNLERDVDRSLEMVWPPTSRARQRKWVEEKAVKAGFQNEWEFQFLIETLDTDQLVGSIDTHHCDLRQGTFEYGLSVREPFRGKGYAAEAILLVLRYYFLELRFQKANPGVYDFNAASIRLHEKLGFVLEGTRRRSGYSHGQFHDMLLYGMTVEEFLERHSEYAEFQINPD